LKGEIKNQQNFNKRAKGGKSEIKGIKTELKKIIYYKL
jgi:hypothetical protein